MRNRYEALELDVVKERITQYCSFSLGKQKIRQTSPCFEEFWVKRELRRTQEAYDLVIRYGNLPFGGIHDIQESIQAAMKDMTLTPQELREIADSARAYMHMQAYMKASEIATPSINELIEAMHDNHKVAVNIERCISMHYEVLDNASADLKTIRKSIAACSGEIAKEVQRFIARNATKLMDTITTIRNERTCVLVKISEKNSIDGLLHGESASGQTAYIEPRSLLVLNNKLQSLKSKEKEEVNRILFMLSQEVKVAGHEFLSNVDTFGLLDSIFAKALWQKAVDGCVATLENNGTHLYLKQARHPLIDPDKVVSNTYEIKKPYHCLLITGSNTGGKTVTLKTIGLFVAMTMCGMPVSGEAMHLPVFDALFVDIGDDQSIQESLSTFSSHLSKLAYIAKHISAKSLVLLDELGSGTDPKEGEPLAVAILDDIRNANAMVIATTHYSALKTYGADNEDILLSSVAFDMEKMRPTYHYIEGVSGQSNAFEIARRYGVKESILAAAKARKERSRDRSEIAIEKLDKSLLENHTLKAELEVRLQDVKALQAALDKQKQQLVQEKEALLLKIRSEAQKQLDDTLLEAQELLEQLKTVKSDVKPHELIQLKTQVNRLHLQDAVEEQVVAETFAIGDYVKLKKLNYYGEVLTIQKDKVCIFANGMKMNTSIKELTHAPRKVSKPKNKGTVETRITSFSMECNVIGMRVAEAIPIIDKYLDNALLAKVYHVRIIHGMGTGALRKGVHDYLKHNAHVESYQMGGQGEGGLGATVVALKQKGVHKHG